MFEQACGGQGVECDGLYMLGPGSGTTRRYGPFGLGVALLEWCVSVGGFKTFILTA